VLGGQLATGFNVIAEILRQGLEPNKT